MATGALWSSARISAASAGKAGVSGCTGPAVSDTRVLRFIGGILDYVYWRAPGDCVTSGAARK